MKIIKENVVIIAGIFTWNFKPPLYKPKQCAAVSGLVLKSDLACGIGVFQDLTDDCYFQRLMKHCKSKKPLDTLNTMKNLTRERWRLCHPARPSMTEF